MDLLVEGGEERSIVGAVESGALGVGISACSSPPIPSSLRTSAAFRDVLSCWEVRGEICCQCNAEPHRR